MRCIGNSRERVVEGKLRAKELSEYLDKIGSEKTVWISEDGTALVPKVNYDVVTDSIVGLVLPINEQTGMPNPLSHKATTANEIVENMKKEKASTVYVVMAQPLNEKFPPFLLQLYGTSGKFTSTNVTNRWKNTENELSEYGIKVAGYSSDGDPRLLSAMCNHLLFNEESDADVVQDLIHIATKSRNRILNVSELPMGTHRVSVQHLRQLLKVDKSIHGLNQTDVSPEDRQNFDSFQKISSTRVLNALRNYVPNSEATVRYLQLVSDVVSSYRDPDLDPLTRIEQNWRSVYFFRIWREHIKASKSFKLKDKFITSNTFNCIEVNARSLINLVRKCRRENKPHYFIPTLFQSQTCEKIFRLLRSMGTVNFTKINFSMLELLYMVGRIEALNEILHFKLFDKGVIFPKFEVDKRKCKIFDMPSEDEMSLALNRAKTHAIEEAKKFGMSLDDNSIENYDLPYKRHINLNGDLDDESETDNEYSYTDAENEYDQPYENEENYGIDNEIEIITNESTSEKMQFTEILSDNGTKKIIRKSSLVWLLSEKGSKLSNDRLKRVQCSTVIGPVHKRTRQNNMQ